MTRFRNLKLCAAVVLSGTACGASQTENTEGGACDLDAADLVGVRSDAVRGCALVEETRLVACSGDDDAVSSGIYVRLCVRDSRSGDEFWVTSSKEVLLAEGWETCSELNVAAPPPCFAASCPTNEFGQVGYPDSLCSEADTRMLFNCGGESSRWDENCCRRPYCETDADCTGGICVLVADPWHSLYAWPYSGTEATCDRAGASQGPALLMCMPADG